MPTPVAVLSGGTRGFELGMFKKGPIAQGFNFPLNTNYTWWNGVDILSTQYLIYTDKYTMGSSTLANTIPVAWSTPDLNDSSLLALINTLPPRVGLPGFTDLDAALNWMDGTGDFFLLKNGIENIVTTNLELYWDAGLYTSYPGTGTAWTDLSGNNRTGTLTNSPVFNSSGVATFNFDGTDDYAITTGPNLTNQATFSCWFRTNTSQTNRYLMAMALSISSGNNGIDIYFDPTTIGSYLSTGSNFANPKFTTNYYDGQWHMATVTFDGSNVRFYYDGILRVTSALSGNLSLDPIRNLTVGSWANGGSNVNAQIPIAQVYSLALSPDQVLQNYNAQKGRFGLPSPVTDGQILQLDAGNQISYPRSGNDWFDLSGYGNDGTLINSPTFDTANGGSINFAGTDDYVILDSYDKINLTEGTVSAWVMFDDISSNRVVVSYGGNGNDRGFLLQVEGQVANKIGFITFRDGGGVYAGNTISEPLVGTWVHHVGVYTSTSTSLYLNGNHIVTNSSTGSLLNSTNLWLGNEPNRNYWLDGKIAQVQIFDRALSAPEIQQNFTASASRYGVGIVKSGLVFNVDGGNFASYIGSGTTWNDIGGGMYDVKLLNGPTYTTSGGGALIFDATDDYGQMNPSVIPVGTQISICFWNYGVSAISSSIIASSYNSSDQTLNIHLPWSNANVYWDCGFPFNRIQKFVSNEEYQGWHHWVFTKNATTGVMNIYLDGSLWHTGSGLTSSIPAMDIASLGNYFTGTLPHNGYIGQCQIYRKELNSTEITQNFTADRLRYGV